MPTLIHSALFSLCLLASNAFAAPPSHCTADEYSIVNAWMGAVNATGGGWRNSKNGKLLSLCADKKTQPFTAITYRYGAQGKVELEVQATPQNKFKFAAVASAPRSGNDVLFFEKGDYTYYVSIATGMGSGVSLYVFKGMKKIVSHFSGNEQDEDYQLGPAEIDFLAKHSPSPVLMAAKPRHTLD